jgi:flavin reductase (DIM6/NTAB) family NADH-FMN oxidoreductase RutF
MMIRQSNVLSRMLSSCYRISNPSSRFLHTDSYLKMSMANENSSNIETKSKESMSSTAITEESFESYCPKELSKIGAIYGLCISAVVPRPIALITTLDSTGENVNCAPFSYTGLVAHDPPMLCHGICLSRGEKKKDTLVNIEDTKKWVVHIISDDFVEKANECATSTAPDVDELKLSKLNTNLLKSKHSDIPRIGEAKVAMECELVHSQPVYNDDGTHTTTIVTGRVVQFHVNKSVLKDHPHKPKVDLQALRACGRAGDITYWPAGEGKALPMTRPK